MWQKGSSEEDEASESERDIIAFIGKGVEFKGVMIYEGTIRIDGRMEGEIQTSGMLVVGDEAVISAKITGGTIVSKGHITGDVTATQRVRLSSPARMDGSIQTPVFAMEDGVLFNGTCDMTAPAVHQLPRDREPGARSAASTNPPKRLSR